MAFVAKMRDQKRSSGNTSSALSVGLGYILTLRMVNKIHFACPKTFFRQTLIPVNE